MDKLNKPLVITCAVLLVVAICCCSSVLLLLAMGGNLPQFEEDNMLDPEITLTPSVTTSAPAITITVVPQNPTELSIFNEGVVFKNATQVYVPEMNLLEQVVKLLETKGWNYRSSSELPLTQSDLAKIDMNRLRQEDTARSARLSVPVDKEQYYLTNEAAANITNTILAARNEYVEYLRVKGVAEKYIQELDQNTLPATSERFKYHPINDPDAPPTAVEALQDANGVKSDFSKQQMDVYPADINNQAGMVIESGILGEQGNSSESYYLKARDMGIRTLVYHEMTHGLQRAFETVNASSDLKTSKSAWVGAERKLFEVTDRYNADWGVTGILRDINNRQVNQESQSDGVAFELMVRTYNMSEVQARLYWEFTLGRLRDAQRQWDYAINYFESKQPGYAVEGIGHEIYKVFSSAYTPGSPETLFAMRLTRRLGALPAYGGYFHPMLPEHAQEFWDFLKQ